MPWLSLWPAQSFWASPLHAAFLGVYLPDHVLLVPPEGSGPGALELLWLMSGQKGLADSFPCCRQR